MFPTWKTFTPTPLLGRQPASPPNPDASPSHHEPPLNPRTACGDVDFPSVQRAQSPPCIPSLPSSSICPKISITKADDLPPEPEGVQRATSVALPQSSAPSPATSPVREPSPKPERTLRIRKVGCEDRTLIARPDGEVGRPGRGGYNLQKTLGLSDKEYKALKRQVNPIVDQHLDYSIVFVSQPAKVMTTVQDEILRLVPGFASYEDNWPIRDFIFGRYQYQRQRLLASRKRVSS